MQNTIDKHVEDTMEDSKNLIEDKQPLQETKSTTSKQSVSDIMKSKEALKKLTVKELIELCKDNNIRHYSGLRKEELVKHIYYWATEKM